jgi:AmmeMemoRadiSam system protein A
MTAGDQQQLLAWARACLTAAVCGQSPPASPNWSAGVREPHAAFVTLKKGGDLRGCIGQMDFARPLWENVAGAAVAAALEDPRFPPVTADELPELRVEISVLEPPVPIARWEDFDVHRHGILVQREGRRALLLPKVAQEYGWGAEQVLRCVCEKAGLPAEAWRDRATQWQVFTAIDFAEA